VLINLTAPNDEQAQERAEDIADGLILREELRRKRWLDYESMTHTVEEVEETT